VEAHHVKATAAIKPLAIDQRLTSSALDDERTFTSPSQWGRRRYGWISAGLCLEFLPAGALLPGRHKSNRGDSRA
jgi:hypothetical protein